MLNLLLIIIEWIFFICTAISVLYISIFVLASRKVQKKIKTSTPAIHRYAVFFPAYKEDAVIEASVRSLLDQDYPKDKFDIIVISDKMHDDTNERLSRLPIKLLKVNFENSSKAKALQFAIRETACEEYDAIVILDADNTVDSDFLSKINQSYSQGNRAIQAHRKAKNLNSETAILDAVSEEINNTIFRAGHVRLGVSSALIGSGMIIEYEWFKNNIHKVFTAGEDKEIEGLLLQQHIHIEYLDDVYVYDEKIQKVSAFKHQRRRWLAAQYSSFFEMCKELPYAIKNKNIDYCDKVFQLSMFPRVINIFLISFFAVLLTIVEWQSAIKWWILFLLFSIILYQAIPKYLLNRKLYLAIRKVPVLAFIMIGNLFRLKGVNKKFLHTNHGECNG